MSNYFLVILKPDAEGRAHELTARFESGGCVLVDATVATIHRDKADELYEEHRGAWYHDRNLDHITSGPCLICCFAGDISRARVLLSSIREGCENPKNLVHVSSSEEAAQRELKLFFDDRYKGDPPLSLFQFYNYAEGLRAVFESIYGRQISRIPRTDPATDRCNVYPRGAD